MMGLVVSLVSEVETIKKTFSFYTAYVITIPKTDISIKNYWIVRLDNN